MITKKIIDIFDTNVLKPEMRVLVGHKDQCGNIYGQRAGILSGVHENRLYIHLDSRYNLNLTIEDVTSGLYVIKIVEE
jgi:hypothetical protein